MGIDDREVGADVGISSVLCVLGVFLVGRPARVDGHRQARVDGHRQARVDGHGPAERRGQRDRWGVLCLEVSTLRS